MSDATYLHYDWVKDPRFPEKLFHVLREHNTVKAIEKYGAANNALDAGCGTGLVTRHIIANHTIGLDINPWALKRAQSYASNVRFMCGDINNLPFEDEYFDLIVCTHTLEHLEHPKQALDELYRVLQPGGLLIGAVPTNFALWHYRRYLTKADIHEEPFHVNYTRKMLCALLEPYQNTFRVASCYLEWQFRIRK